MTNQTAALTPSVTALMDDNCTDVTATVNLPVPPERVFQALTSEEICTWWVNPGIFDTREWRGEIRVGGDWEASGIGNGRPYTLAGTYLEIAAPERLVHSWRAVGGPPGETTVTYQLEPAAQGTRLTLRHEGFAIPEVCAATHKGWETSFSRLAELLADEMRVAG